ncbi:single-stranded DNA-binding protein, partial [Carnobacterium maltaromaticum]
TVILCQVWGKMAENLCKYQAKGSLISIQNGEIETSSWVDGNVTKYVTKVQIRPWSSIKYLESSSVTENRVLQSIDKEAQAYEQGI